MSTTTDGTTDDPTADDTTTINYSELTGFKRDLLFLVAGLDDPHGLAIKHEMEQYYEGEVHPGRLYPNLDDLVAAGLVAKGELDGRTNYYDLTKAGYEALQARREWENEYVDQISE